ncbi:MAG: trypsin-like peptidase domain-containing protein [Anaerolineae bacterium]|nr:MAG: trypsin-like peptidase domain-containing protein [Anaerolineae bacterium]
MILRNNKYLVLFFTLLLLATAACGVSSITSQGADSLSKVSDNSLVAEEQTVSENADSVPTAEITLTNSDFAAEARQSLDGLDLQSRLIELYDLVNPSVVQILVYTSKADRIPLGSGSGFVYDSEGRIVTNNHVVADGAVFEVVFSDGSRSYADVVGRDVDSDLAVIEVENLPENANPVELGDSDQLHAGQLVIAIGNPFGEQGSMSLGIISGLGRSLESQRILDNTLGNYSLPQVIQTDAPINPGNSGGPLLNMDAQVIGVNSAIRSTTGVNSGVGFSIPVNAVKQIIPVLIEEGEYKYSYMGIQIQSLNLNLQERYDLLQPFGAYVTGVTPGAPADDAGLIPANRTDGKGGDLIIAIEGQVVENTESLIAYLVFKSKVGQTVDLTVIRDGETISLPMTLGARP